MCWCHISPSVPSNMRLRQRVNSCNIMLIVTDLYIHVQKKKSKQTMCELKYTGYNY